MPRRVLVPDDFGYRPFTLADAKQLGLGCAFVRGSQFRRVFRGVFIRAEVVDSAGLRFDAARQLTRHAIWATCHTAAEILGAPVPTESLTHIGLPPGADGPDRDGMSAHRYEVRPVVQMVAGRRVATSEDVFLQLAAYLDLVDLVVVGDALVRLGRTTTDALVQATNTSAGGRGVRLARRAAMLVRDRVDSPMETRLRLLIVLGGLPEPETNVDAIDAAGEWIARPHLSYPKLRIALEYDGSSHLRTRQRRRDIRRREMYDAEDWRVLVVVERDLDTFPSQTLMRIWIALRERRHPHVTRELSDGWRPFFDPRVRRHRQNSPSATSGR